MKENVSPDGQKAWIALMRTSRATQEELGQLLKAGGLPPLEWYDILWELEKAEPDGLRPQELETKTLLRQYQMSRVLKRMEISGLVTIAKLDSDKRGQLVRLTADGKQARTDAWQTYGAFLSRTFDERLKREELETLACLLTKLNG